MWEIKRAEEQRRQTRKCFKKVGPGVLNLTFLWIFRTWCHVLTRWSDVCSKQEEATEEKFPSFTYSETLPDSKLKKMNLEVSWRRGHFFNLSSEQCAQHCGLKSGYASHQLASISTEWLFQTVKCVSLGSDVKWPVHPWRPSMWSDETLARYIIHYQCAKNVFPGKTQKSDQLDNKGLFCANAVFKVDYLTWLLHDAKPDQKGPLSIRNITAAIIAAGSESQPSLRQV